MLYLLLKYVIGFILTFFPFKNLNFSQTNLEGWFLACFILMFYPIIDIALFAFPMYFSIKNIYENNRFKKVSFLIIPIMFLVEIYITMITSQNKLMEWHIWKSVVGFCIFFIVFSKIIFNTSQTFKATNSFPAE